MRTTSFLLPALAIAALLPSEMAFADPASTAAAAPATPVKTVQTVMFDGLHFASTPTPNDLYYVYDYESALPDKYGKKFKDQVQVHLDPGKEADEPIVRLDLFTGDYKRDPIHFGGLKENPVILMFLEEDLWHMRILTNVKPGLIKAFVEDAFKNHSKVEDATAKFEGKDVPVTRITLKPFDEATDPQLAPLHGKTYEFLFSDAVPGEVLELQTAIADPHAAIDQVPDVSQTISFDHTGAPGVASAKQEK
jgi:hypothetical protein